MIDKDKLDSFLSDYGALCERHGLMVEGGRVKPLSELGEHILDLTCQTSSVPVFKVEEPEPVFEPEPDLPPLPIEEKPYRVINITPTEPEPEKPEYFNATDISVSDNVSRSRGHSMKRKGH